MESYKSDAVRIAKELQYNMWLPRIEERIRSARSETEVQRLLITARQKWIAAEE